MNFKLFWVEEDFFKVDFGVVEMTKVQQFLITVSYFKVRLG